MSLATKPLQVGLVFTLASPPPLIFSPLWNRLNFRDAPIFASPHSSELTELDTSPQPCCSPAGTSPWASPPASVRLPSPIPPHSPPNAPAVFLFTTILFYSGYFLQQRTVRDIQAVLHPPQPTPTLLPHNPYDSAQSVLAPPGNSALWHRTAYASIAREPRDACAAAVLFAQLARAHSPAARLLLYPAAWDAAPDPDAPAGRSVRRMGTAARLLRKARDRYGATLRAVPSLAEEAGDDTAAELQRVEDYERLLWLRGPGLVRDGRALDDFFGAEMGDGTVVRWPEREGGGDVALLVRPGAEGTADGQVATVGLEDQNGRALGSTAALRGRALDEGDSTTGSDAHGWAYVQFDDPGVAGPEFDVPDAVLAQARPAGEAGRAWDKLYDEYRWLRMDVCGLDLEPLPASSS